MSPSFHIPPTHITAAETNLFAELSNAGLSFFFQKNDDKMITGLSVFNFAQKDSQHNTADVLKIIFTGQEFLKETFNKIYFICAYPDSLLTPADYYNLNHKEENLNLVHGDFAGAAVFTDYIAEKSIYNIYRFPEEVHLLINHQFGPLTVLHQYSLLLKQLPDIDDVLKVIVYPAKIVTVLQKEGKLQTIVSFKYTTADDVAYHMLNLCKQFTVTNISVQVCGMIEKDAALITEIRKYFQHVNFSDFSGDVLCTEEIKKYPTHFFSHLFAYTLCV